MNFISWIYKKQNDIYEYKIEYFFNINVNMNLFDFLCN